MSDVYEEAKQTVKSATNAIGDMAEGAVAAVGGVGGAVGAVVTGGSVSDQLAKTTDGIAKAGSGYLDAATGGQGAKLDAVSGGLYSATKNVYQTPSDLLNGKSVRDNLQDAGRLGIVAASGGYGGMASGFAVNQALVGRDGKSDISLKSLARAGGSQVGGIAGNILKQIGYEPPQKSSGGGISQGGYFSDIPTDIFQGADKKNIIIPIIIIGVVATVLFIKRKK